MTDSILQVDEAAVPGEWFYGVYDLKAGMLLNGFLHVLPTHGAAERWFRDLVANQDGPVYRHPGDYVLVCIGKIDYDTLKVVSFGVGASMPICTGASVARSMVPESEA